MSFGLMEGGVIWVFILGVFGDGCCVGVREWWEGGGGGVGDGVRFGNVWDGGEERCGSWDLEEWGLGWGRGGGVKGG